MIESGDGGPEAKSRGIVFISYSRSDAGFADSLKAALSARGFEPLLDRTNIYPFEDWWRRIQSLMIKADAVIFVLSPDAISSMTCRKEVRFAASLNKHFVPIVCRAVDVANVPSELSQLNFISFEDAARIESNADKLAEVLSTNIEWIRKHTEFGDLARRWWEASPRPRGLLLRPPMLEEAERWIAYRPKDVPSPREATRSFIAESLKAETLARARRQRRQRIAVLLCGMMLLLISAGIGWWKQNFLKEMALAVSRALK
jgi:hypothetical protein